MRYNRLLQKQLLFILVLAGFIRILNLEKQSLWHDEIQSYVIAKQASVTGVLNYSFERTTQPPIYYVLLRAVLKIGEGEGVQRSISVLAGIASVLILFYIGHALFDRRTGLVSAFLLAISPYHIYYSQESRPYSLFLFFSLLSILLLIKSLESNRRHLWVGFVIANVLAVYTHTIGFQLFVIQFFLATFLLRSRFSWSKVKNLAICWFVSIFFLLPFILQILKHSYRIPAFQTPPRGHATLIEVAYTMYSFVTGFSLGPSLRELHVHSAAEIIHQYFPLISLVAALSLVLLFLSFRYLSKHYIRLSLLVSWLIIPFLMTILLSHFMNSIYQVRYLILALPALTIIFALGILNVSNLWQRNLLFGLLVGVSFWSLINYNFNSKYFKEDTRSTGTYLTAKTERDDLILVNPSYFKLDISYYFDGETQIVGFPASKRIEMRNNGLAPFDRLKPLIKDKKKLWLVWGRIPEGGHKNKLKAILDSKYPLLDTRKWAGVQVFVYDINPA